MAASSMSLEEKVEALTISYQTVTQANSEMAQRLKEVTQQNEYLRKQLGNSLKQKQQILEEHLAVRRENKKHNERIYLISDVLFREKYVQ